MGLEIVFFCKKKPHHPCTCDWFQKLRNSMPHFSEDFESKAPPHLFLMSQDSVHTNTPWQRNMILGSTRHYLATYGPSNLVIPSLNVKTPFITVKPFEERSIFLLAQFRIRYADRTFAAEQVKAYNGSKRVIRDHNFSGRTSTHMDHLPDSASSLNFW